MNGWVKLARFTGYAIVVVISVMVIGLFFLGVKDTNINKGKAEGNVATETTETDTSGGRFTQGRENKVVGETFLPTGNAVTIITDNETECNYVLAKSFESITMTPLLTKEGKPQCGTQEDE